MVSEGEVKWEDTKAQRAEEQNVQFIQTAEQKRNQKTSGNSLAKTTEIDKGESPLKKRITQDQLLPGGEHKHGTVSLVLLPPLFFWLLQVCGWTNQAPAGCRVEQEEAGGGVDQAPVGKEGQEHC